LEVAAFSFMTRFNPDFASEKTAGEVVIVVTVIAPEGIES
jgi:hypothetical protein